MPPFEASSRKALRLIGGHTSAPVLELRTSGEGKAKWKRRGRTVIYGGNRESDNCRKLKEFSFAWPRSFTPAVSCDILQKKHTELHHSSDSRESEVEGGKRCKQKIRNSGLASRKWMGVTAAMVPLGGLTVCGHAWEELERL